MPRVLATLKPFNINKSALQVKVSPPSVGLRRPAGRPTAILKDTNVLVDDLPVPELHDDQKDQNESEFCGAQGK